MRKILFTAGVLLIAGCNSLPVKNSTIQNETQLSKMDPSVLQPIIASEKKDDDGMFTSAKVVTLKDYKIMFTNASDKIYIIKDNDVVAGLDGDNVYIYNDPTAPLFGSESVVYDGNYIRYKGRNFVYEDYGLNGLNTIEVKTPDDPKNEKWETVVKRDGTVCKSTAVYRLACCREGKSRKFTPYSFTGHSGWTPVENDDNANKICKSAIGKPKYKPRHKPSEKVVKNKSNANKL